MLLHALHAKAPLRPTTNLHCVSSLWWKRRQQVGVIKPLRRQQPASLCGARLCVCYPPQRERVLLLLSLHSVLSRGSACGLPLFLVASRELACWSGLQTLEASSSKQPARRHWPLTSERAIEPASEHHERLIVMHYDWARGCMERRPGAQ